MNAHRRGRRQGEIRDGSEGLRELPQSLRPPGRSTSRAEPASRRTRRRRAGGRAGRRGFRCRDRVVRRFQAKVFGLALAVTRDPALADDVAQEAFLRAWRSAPTYAASAGRSRRGC